MQIPKDYFERVYSGWLGKIIGIRLGAPIEGWSYQEIENVYGELTGYPADYHDFAADDDSNGPLFFIRALEDCKDMRNFSSSHVADALLNYAPFEHGFFWWGGYGISTEHTAYLNLRNGIPAPRSGSIAQNGEAVAEQIGGQIFIDPWGLVAPCNPELAKELATKAAGVTHGGEGVLGGVFVACAISIAFGERDIRTILESALKYIPGDCEYATVTKAVMAFHDAHPENWRDCFGYVFENFGYDQYPGNCHIIPNAAVMILAMLYGKGDFEDTINICNMCGWDTDCNVGNVGCIMGVACGLEGIDYDKWAKPINDFCANSSVVGSLNAMDIPYGASYFAKMAYLISGEAIPENWKEILGEKIESCHFEYPRSTHAIRGHCSGGYHIRNTREAAHSGEHSLKITALRSSSGQENFFYKRTYYKPCDFDDSRYDPAFSPLVYPGQTVHVSVMPDCAPKQMDTYIQIYVRNGRTGEIIRGDRIYGTERKWYVLSMRIPSGSDYIDEAGIIVCGTDSGFRTGALTVYMDDLYFDGKPDYCIDFRKENVEFWTGLHQEISQFSRLKGVSYLQNEFLSLACCDFGEMYTGHHSWKDYEFTATLKPITGEQHFVNFRVQGAMRSYAVGFGGSGELVLLKNQNGYSTLAKMAFAWKPEKEYTFKISVQGGKIAVFHGDKCILSYEDAEPIPTGCVGVSVQKGSHCMYKSLIIKGI